MSWALFAAIDVFGEPKGQPRPRAFSRGGHASVYNPSTAEGWKGAIALAALFHRPSSPLECPIKLAITFFFPRPARLLRRKSPVGTLPHTKKPDADNAAKAVMDSLTEIGFWRDDALVVSLVAEKFYADLGQASGALIQIFTLEGES